jgi:hypothetical protein
VIIDIGFFNWITVKYNVLQQRHRRFPPLTLLKIKYTPILQSLPLKMITTLQSHTHHYLNQNLFFNVNLFARDAGKAQIFLKEPLKMKKGVQLLINHLETHFMQHAYPVFSHPSAVSATPTTMRHWESNFSRFYQSGKTTGEIIRTLEKLKETKLKENVKVLNSTAVFKPMLTAAKLQPVSTHFQGFLYLEGQGKFTPVNREKQELITRKQASPGTLYQDSKKSAPALNYTSPMQNTLQVIKKTVAEVEKKVTEEITAIKKSYPDSVTTSYHQQAVPHGMSADINQLTDRVYSMLERKIKTEKERRGW